MAPAKKRLRVTETIIQEVQNHPSLWDKRHKNYKDFVVNSNAWEEILANVKSEFSNEDTLEQIETIDELKNICQVEHSRHRSFGNFISNLIAGLVTYSFFSKKPAIKYETEKTNQLACFY